MICEDCEVFTLSEQDGTQNAILERPANEDKRAWEAYWRHLGQPWRKEPEISKERQEYLTEKRKIESDFEQDFFPFKDIKLSRADIEWLLATHDNNRGPIDWNDESQRKRKGLDLLGADLRGLDLSRLPLAKCHLKSAHLEGASLSYAHLEGAFISEAHLEGADLYFSHLEKAILFYTHLEGAKIYKSHLEDAHLKDAHLEEVNLNEAHLERAVLRGAHLERAVLRGAHLEKADLSEAHLEKVDLSEAHLEKAILFYTHLEGAVLNGAFFDGESHLDRIKLSNDEHGTASLSDIHWGEVNVAVVDWSKISRLGDESDFDYETATRAYRQLSTALRNQGLNEDAARFTYRAQLMQREVFYNQNKYGQYLFSLFLDLLSGYGYKPWRCFAAYLLVILTFAIAYFIFGHTVGPVLSPLGSAVFSMTSFHGRGFFPGGIGLDDPLTVIAALEAFVGLLIEVTFIATLTQRLFGR